jgi:hypothetical protein
MPRLEMKLGAEPKKVAILVGLLLIAAYFLYTNVLNPADERGPAATRPPSTGASLQKSVVSAQESLLGAAGRAAPPLRTRVAGGRSEFRPSLKPQRPEDAPDPTTLDPSLRIDLLEKLAKVKVDQVDRSLFDFSTAKTSPTAAAKPTLPEPRIVVAKRMIGPEPPPPPPPPPVKPPPPPINLKFYGASLPLRGGAKRVFCIDGEEIYTPSEGELIKKRYRIIHINANSVVVEDVDYKNQQTLPIEQPPRNG